MKIGLFDSGIGGTTILKCLQDVLPDEKYKYIADSKNCPYGDKTDSEIESIVTANVDALRDWGAKIIVIACNTATTRCISYLREKYPEIQFVGTEPAIKLAAESGAKRILVMATTGTIESERTKALLEEYQKPEQTIELMPCPGLADIIEKNYDSDLEPIKSHLSLLFKDIDYSPDVVVLGCTHYSLIKDLIQTFFKSARLVDGNIGVASRVKKIVEKSRK